MKNNKKILAIGVSVLLVAAVSAVYYFKFYLPSKSETRTYTLEDFPNALQRMTEAEAEERIEKLNQEINSIKADERLYPSWINVGLYKRVLGDNEGAEKAWKNALAINPDSILANGNLAELYMYDYNDNAKAEECYKRAIELDATNYTFYDGLATLYRYRLTDKANLIEEIMNQGAEKNTKEVASYYGFLAGYFEEEGNDPQKAKLYREKADAAK